MNMLPTTSTLRSLILTGTVALAALAVGTAPAIAGPPVAAPRIDSEAALSISPFDAVLEARITPENEATEYHFEYSTSNTMASAATLAGATLTGNIEELAAGPVDIGGGLTPGTTYFYRVLASNATGTSEGPVQAFTTPPTEKPAVETGSSSAITQSTATLAASVNPVFQPLTRCELQYVTETVFNETGFTGSPASMNCTPTAGELGQGDSPSPVTANITGLPANTTYKYRLVAANATGTSEAAPQQLLTLPPLPIVNTGPASEITSNSAQITGSVNPASTGINSDTTYFFQYSTDTSYSNQIPLLPGDAGQGETPVPVAANLTGLAPATTYHYRILASNNNTGTAQTSEGEGHTFTTTTTPPQITGATTSQITPNTAVITAILQAQELPTRWELQLGTNPGALQFKAAANTTAPSPEPLTVSLEHLTPNTTYYYKLTATNPDGSAETETLTFTTTPGPPALPTLAPTPSPPLLTVPAITFPTETANTASPPAKKLTRAQKLALALKACHKKHANNKRTTCEHQAHHRYPRQTTAKHATRNTPR
jgi:phosphodiesterase/alkaline phosphatase D-like protein